MTTSAVSTAQRFAAALDANDWTAVGSLLAGDCEYAVRGDTIVGPKPIVASYKTTADWVDATFTGVVYTSEVEAQGDGVALVTLRDQMSHGARHLDFRCQQRVTVDGDGRIARIEHIDLPGEPEKVAAFNQACGVTRP